MLLKVLGKGLLYFIISGSLNVELSMASFEKLYSMGHEQVVYFSDPTCDLKAIIAIHDTTLGPALGGTRMWPYSSEEDALEDVLRLSRGMTYKAAVSGLNLGGGKGVIIGDPKSTKSEALFRSYGPHSPICYFCFGCYGFCCGIKP